MKRRILLVEPKYKNKYPPIGLMKIATYHKEIGDSVSFFKGNINDLVIDELAEKCLNDISSKGIDLFMFKAQISRYIKNRKKENLVFLNSYENKVDIINILSSYAKIFRDKDFNNYPKWDRVYVTTLFTFYWKITVTTINDVKNIVKDNSDIFVGGVLASLLFDEIKEETGITPFKGLLDKPGILDKDIPMAKNYTIDNLPLDYSILDEIDYKYPTGSAYFTFMTKGCTRKCAFCSVPILEPTYKPKIETVSKFELVKEKFGDQQNLLLMDNNVLASPNFEEIINEIIEMGFHKGATYVEPNQLDLAIKNLNNGYTEKAFENRCFNLLNDFYRRLTPKRKQEILLLFDKFEIVEDDRILRNKISKEKILELYNSKFGELYEKYRYKKEKLRYVDFNQGTDARYVNEENMYLMSKIPIKPLRIAFDYWGMKKQYESAIRIAAKYEIKEFSNYILYNFKDTPEELYSRLELNVNLGEELNMHIYSFPMKYIPLFGEEAKDRHFIGKKWNRKYIRAVQSILNVTKGIVAPGRNFFENAFGKNLEEFMMILLMPEAYIIYRSFFEKVGMTKKWKKTFNKLSESEKNEAISIITKNDFKNAEEYTTNKNILELLKHYSIRREDVEKVRLLDLDYTKTKKHFGNLIKNDVFKNLTLTYDYENPNQNNVKKLINY
jgi:hypothetical protein